MALRNVVHRRNHKERAQPGNRRKLGLLEKHKDYVERARDHHSKQDRLKRLQQKAALRNADEFNFGMIKGGGGRTSTSAAEALLQKQRAPGALKGVRREDASMDNDVVALLKTQDLGYIRSALRSEDKKMEHLRQQIRPGLGFMSDDWLRAKDGRQELLQRQGLLQSLAKGKSKAMPTSLSAPGKKIVWVDSVDEARRYKPGESLPSQTSSGKDSEYSLEMQDDWDVDSSEDDEAVASDQVSSKIAAEKRLGRLVSELAQREARRQALDEARGKLETVRSLMSTRGQTTTKKGGARTDAIKDAVSRGKVTANGLALPGNDDDDEDEEEEEHKNKGKNKVVWKWGKERKR